MISVAAVLGLMFVSFLAASVGASAYKVWLEKEAGQFADQAFERIFTNHDGEFLLDRITARGLIASGGREQLIQFVKTTALQTGDLHNINRTDAWLKLTYGFPINFGCIGRVTAQAAGTAGLSNYNSISLTSIRIGGLKLSLGTIPIIFGSSLNRDNTSVGGGDRRALH